LKVFIGFISNKYILIKVYDFVKFYLFMLHGLHVVVLVAQLGMLRGGASSNSMKLILMMSKAIQILCITVLGLVLILSFA